MSHTIFIRTWNGKQGRAFTTAHFNPKNAGAYLAKNKKRYACVPGPLQRLSITRVQFDKLTELMGSELGVKIELLITS